MNNPPPGGRRSVSRGSTASTLEDSVRRTSTLASGPGASPAAHTAAQAERLDRLFGEFKGLRSQFTEFRKQVLGGKDMNHLKEEMKTFRAEISATRDANAFVQTVRGTIEQHSGALAQMRQLLDATAQQVQAAAQGNQALRAEIQRLEQSSGQASAQGMAGLQREQQALRADVQRENQALRADIQRQASQVDPLVQQLRQMQQEQARMEREQQGLTRDRQAQEQQQQRLQQMAQEQQTLKRKNEEVAQQLNRKHEEVAQQLTQHFREVNQKVQALDTAKGQATEAKREVEKFRQQHETMVRKQEEAMQKVNESSRTVERHKQESQRSLDQVKQEVNSMKNEYNGAKGAQKEHQAHLRRLEEKTRGMDVLQQLKTTVDTTGYEFFTLKKKLYDSGILAPPKIPEPEKTPVGTLELGEDCYTARLLLRLGSMKAMTDQIKEAQEARGIDVDDDLLETASLNSSDAGLALMTSGLIDNLEEDVTGLAIPEIEPSGQRMVTVGWIFICVSTLAIQVLIVFIMVLYGIDSGDDCMKEPLTPTKWYMLHVSKATATLAAGALMGKELMDIVNYWMVSELLETKTSPEVVISAVLRISLILFIAMANVIIFMTMTSPADVWINMTALGFIGELSNAVLDIAKKGVFGHDIGKAVTSINFSLNFMTDYPWWFAWARGTALLIAAGFIGFFAFVLYILPDNVCLENGKSEAGGLLDRVFGLFS